LDIVSAVLYALFTIQHAHHHHYTTTTARQGAALSQHKFGLAWNLRNTSDNLKHFWPKSSVAPRLGHWFGNTNNSDSISHIAIFTVALSSDR
jgi:hypothetical protein